MSAFAAAAAAASANTDAPKTPIKELFGVADYQTLAAALDDKALSAEVLARRFIGQRFTDFKVTELREIQRWLRDTKQPANPYWTKPAPHSKTAIISQLMKGMEHYRKTHTAQTNNPSGDGQPQPSYANGGSSTSQQSRASYYNQQTSQYNQFQQPQMQSQQYSYPTSSAPMNGGPPYINNYSSQQYQSNGQSRPQGQYPYNGNPTLLSSMPQPQQPTSQFRQAQYPPAQQQSYSQQPAMSTAVIDQQLQQLVAHPNFSRHRSPYEVVQLVLAKHWLAPQGASSYSTRIFLQFTLPNNYLTRLRKKAQPNGDLWVHVRLFSAASLDHAWFAPNGFRVRVNAHDVTIPDAKKLSKSKKKGLELVRPLTISEFVLANNYIEIELIKQQITGPELFRGAVVIELCGERSTNDLLTALKMLQETQMKKQSVISTFSAFRPSPKQCSVCASTKDLLRCSRCKNEWYCGEEHQRAHWTMHRAVCKPPTLQQQKEQEEYEKQMKKEQGEEQKQPHTANLNVPPGPTVSSKPLQRGTNGRIILTMPVRVKTEAVPGAAGNDDILAHDPDIADDEIAEVDTKVSLKDPISLERLELAAKGRNCVHLPCFDVATFLQFSQQSGVWQCPICYSPVPYEELVINREMSTILAETDSECAQIRVQPNGEWEPIDNEEKKNKKQKTSASTSIKSSPVPIQAALSAASSNVIALDDSTAPEGRVDMSIFDTLIVGPDSYSPAVALARGVSPNALPSRPNIGTSIVNVHDSLPYVNNNPSPSPTVQDLNGQYSSFPSSAALRASFMLPNGPSHSSSTSGSHSSSPTNHDRSGTTIEDAIELD